MEDEIIQPPKNSIRIGAKLMAPMASDAAFIGGLTILGYLVSYNYLSSKALVLGIPLELVSVSLETCLFVMLVLLTFILFLVLLVNGVMSAIPEELHDDILFRSFCILMALFAVITTPAVFIYSPLYFFIPIPLLALGAFLAMPFFGPKSAGTYKERLKAKALANVRTRRDREKSYWVEKRLGLPVTTALGAIAVCVIAGAGFGHVNGELTSYYFATTSMPSEILLAKYGDVLVFRQQSSPAITIKVIGKDYIPPLMRMHTGSMALPPLEPS